MAAIVAIDRSRALSDGFEFGQNRPLLSFGESRGNVEGAQKGGRRCCLEHDFFGGDVTVQRKPSSIDEYLKNVPADRRRILEDLRAKIRALVPGAEECISYRIPAFRINGVVFAGFCATSKGCSYFPFSGSTLKTLARDLTRYDQTKSSLHFSTDRPLPTVLVRKLIRARVAETKE